MRPATSRSRPGPGMYLQPRIAGRAGSAVFLADGHRLRLLGMNRLYPLAPARGDYRHAVVMCTRPGSLPAGLWRLVRGTGLKGLCGMDFIVGSGGQMHILELNARPPASAELHTQSALTLHLQACAGRLHCHRRIRAYGVRALAVCLRPSPGANPAHPALACLGGGLSSPRAYPSDRGAGMHHPGRSIQRGCSMGSAGKALAYPATTSEPDRYPGSHHHPGQPRPDSRSLGVAVSPSLAAAVSLAVPGDAPASAQPQTRLIRYRARKKAPMESTTEVPR